MTFPTSENVSKMKTSSTFKAMQAAANLREQGFDVIDLTVGEPDFPTPEFIKDLAIEGLHKNITKYTASAGMKPLPKPFRISMPNSSARNFRRRRWSRRAAENKLCSMPPARFWATATNA